MVSNAHYALKISRFQQFGACGGELSRSLAFFWPPLLLSSQDLGGSTSSDWLLHHFRPCLLHIVSFNVIINIQFMAWA